MFLLWNSLLFGLLIIDMLVTPSKKRLKVRRQQYDKLYFKAENEIQFYVQNTSTFGLLVHGRDESQRHFNVKSGSLSHWLKSKEEVAFSYVTIPAKRGSFAFSNIYLRYGGILGLCMKYAKVPAHTEFKVYPNVRDLSKYRIMMQRSRLLPEGDKTIRQYGMGAEFESLRPYVEGDDYRKINWTATARENKFIVNQYQIERNQPVYVLLDTGRPMSYSVNGFKKLDYAINAALILADIANQQGDKAGLMVFDSSVKSHISPGQGASHRNLLMETLYHVEDNRSTADYEGAFRTLCERQKRRSLVFIFTDFEILEEAEELISHMAILKRRHMPIVVFMANESLSNMTTSPTITPFDQVLKNTANEFMEERKTIFRTLALMGIPNVESTAENFAVAAVNRYVQLAKV